MQHKITGYLLLCIGLLVMLFAVVSMYKVFVGGQPAVTVIQLADMNMKSQMGVMTIPMGNFNTLVNLGLFAIFMLFLVTVGGKLASLGYNFLKIERIYEALAHGDKTLTQDDVKKL